MIIPYAENIECSALICALHSLTDQYKYKAYIVKQFPRLITLYSEQKYTITQMYRSVKNEYKSVKYGFTDFHFICDYKKTLELFMVYLQDNYLNEYPEMII